MFNRNRLISGGLINRNKSIICVVEDIRIMMAIENTMQFKGVYHVLGGLISPMDGISPNDLKINELKERIVKENTKEIILISSAFRSRLIN